MNPQLGLSLIWQLALPLGLYVFALAALTIAYRDRTLLRFLGAIVLCEVYLLVAGSLRYELSETALGNIALAFLFVVSALMIWLTRQNIQNRWAAIFLTTMGFCYAVLVSAMVVVRDS